MPYFMIVKGLLSRVEQLEQEKENLIVLHEATEKELYDEIAKLKQQFEIFKENQSNNLSEQEKMLTLRNQQMQEKVLYYQ